MGLLVDPAGGTSSPSSCQKSAERGAGCGAAGVQPRVLPAAPSSTALAAPIPAPVALGPGSGSFQGPVAAFPRLPWAAHTLFPPLPPLSDGPLSLFLPSRRRSELLYLFARGQSLPPRTCLLGEWPAPSSRPAPGPSALSGAPGPLPRALRPVLSSRHSRGFPSRQNALLPPPPPSGLGREGVDFELNSQGFYSILLTALLSLFFFA